MTLTGAAVTHLHRVHVPMRDGRVLLAEVLLPPGEGPFPASLMRTPYGAWTEVERSSALARDGVAIVVQDVAGRFESEGRFTFLELDTDDALDTLRWIARQPWCDGRVALRGSSYRGFLQWGPALRRAPELRALAPLVAPRWDKPSLFRAPGGPVQLTALTHWMPRQAAEVFGIPRTVARRLYERSFEPEQIVRGSRISVDALMAHPGLSRWNLVDAWPVEGSAEFEPVWRSIFATPPARASWDDALPAGDSVAAPALLLGGWYDPAISDVVDSFRHLTRTGPEDVRRAHRLIALPLGHGDPLAEWPVGEGLLRFGLDPDHDWACEWLLDRDHVLRDLEPVTYFLLGPNRWESAPSWPPPGAAPRTWFLDARTRTLAARAPDADASLRFDYDPRDPVVSRGGRGMKLPVGPMDQEGLTGGARADVLSFDGEPLDEPLVLTGPVEVELFASSSARDTDFTAKLIDLAPDGRAMSICDGIVRARYRNGPRAQPLAPGATERLRIRCGHIAYVVAPGHRLRVDISSSNFPVYDRNPNTGAPEGTGDERDVVVARQRVQGCAAFPSNVTVWAS